MQRPGAVDEAHLKEDLFVSSTVVHFSDSTTVFAQGPMVKHLALSKECFSSSPFKVCFHLCAMSQWKDGGLV